jgi:excisionase family DNA binding protein
MDVLFLCFLRLVERFGYFHLGPITINVRVVEERVDATVLPGADPHAITEDWVRFSRLLMKEVRLSGRKRVDELHYLFAFMRCNEGIAAQVFGELGVTPAQVEAYLKSGIEETGPPDRWMTPEEVADFLRVHVQTVRAWIRGGKLPARRVYGMRSLRVRAVDAANMLRPIDEEDNNTLELRGGDS